jgi:hypothetical protein
MLSYFFHVHRAGQVILDPEGTPLASVEEARQEARLVARELIIHRLKTDQPVSLEDSVDVADEHGAVLHTVTFKEALA